ncbi:MAG: hypothetical protein M0P99_02205 [Candidatus Cloacimonetes bacterium]|nr:hypothetical protein [Candidatus Cloacimonadota bacterium]
MSVLLDVLGSVIIGAMLLMMMTTFQIQLQESSQRILYVATMVDNMDMAATKINKTFALAGIGMPVDSVCVIAETNRVAFKTFWDCNSDTLSTTRHTIEIKIADTANNYGKALIISQDGTPMTNAGYIFYIEAISFIYYNKSDVVTNSAGTVRSADVLLTFRRDSNGAGNRPLRTNIQVKCYFMNSYLQGA